MPIYEYQCQTCGQRLETLQKMSDTPRTDCPACHAPALKKLMSAAAVQARDRDLFAELARWRCISVFVTITTLDAALAGQLEPRAVSTRA